MSETKNLKLFKHDNPTTNTNKFDVDKALNQNWDKLDDKIGDISISINEINEEGSTTEQDISNIKKEQKTKK